MANISSPSGTITIISADKNVADTLAAIIDTCDERGWYYSTIFDDDGEMMCDENGLWSFSALFGGNGRWTYTANAECMGKWIEQDFENGALPNYDQSVLINADWTIHYDFLDEECGCRCLYEQTSRLVHKAGTKLSESEFIIDSETDYDYTIANLVKLGCRDSIDDALDYLGWEYSEDDRLQKALAGEKDDMCTFFGEPWEQLLADNPYLNELWDRTHSAASA